MSLNNPSFVAVLSLVGLFSLPPGSIRADGQATLSLSDVLSRHRQALGGTQALAVPKTERISGTVDQGGLHGTFSAIHAGDKYWTETKIGINDAVSGYDGKIAWQRDSNGNVRSLSSAELEDLHNQIYSYENSDLIAGGQPGQITVRPQRDHKTGDYLLDITPEGGKACVVSLDPKTFLIVKEQYDDDNVLITETDSDFKSINSIMTATVTHVSDGDKKSDLTYTLTDDQINVAAPDTLFTIPVTSHNYIWVHPETPNEPIPYDPSDHSIKLLVGIDGVPAYLTLDSGASDMALAKWATDSLKLNHQGTFRVQGYGGSTNVYPVHLDTLEIADGVIFKDMIATTIDLPENFGIGEATPSVGFMGYELLSRFVVQIDFHAQHLTLYDPEIWKPSESDGQALPIEIDDNVPSVMAQIDGQPARFLIDTGDAGAFVRLYRPFVTEHRIDETYPKGMKVYGYGVGGISATRRARCASFTLAGTTLKDVPIDIALDDKGGASRWEAGALGYRFLSHFTVTFDYAHQRVFFAPNPETSEPFDIRTFGLYAMSMPDELVKNKRNIMVAYVDPQSPAYRAGVVPGDIITQVDGQSAEIVGLSGVRRLLSPDGGQDTRDLSIIGPLGGTGKVKVTLYDPMPKTRDMK